jgi:FMN phosphatase YigB (HAD superfamily)
MAYIFSSNYPVGSFKPNPGMYAQVAAVISPEKILHVAGAPIDALGAREFGLYSALLHEKPLPGAQPCFVFPDITGLLSVFTQDK